MKDKTKYSLKTLTAPLKHIRLNQPKVTWREAKDQADAVLRVAGRR